MTNDETVTKSECRKKQRRGFSHLNIRISFDIRHPSFAAYKPYKMRAPDLCLRGFVIFSAPASLPHVSLSCRAKSRHLWFQIRFSTGSEIPRFARN